MNISFFTIILTNVVINQTFHCMMKLLLHFHLLRKAIGLLLMPQYTYIWIIMKKIKTSFKISSIASKYFVIIRMIYYKNSIIKGLSFYSNGNW